MGFFRWLVELLTPSAGNAPKALRSPIQQQEFVVVGLGRFGSSVAFTLVERGFTVLGIDSDIDLVQRYADDLTQTLRLDATDEDALREADIPSYDTAIVAIGTNLEANLLATVALKALGVRNVVCKAATLTQRDILLKVGADRVVLPEFEAGVRLAQELVVPGIVDQISLGSDAQVCEMRVPASIVGKTVGELDLPKRYKLSLIAVNQNGQAHKNPDTGFRLLEGDFLVVMGSHEDIVRLCQA